MESSVKQTRVFWKKRYEEDPNPYVSKTYEENSNKMERELSFETEEEITEEKTGLTSIMESLDPLHWMTSATTSSKFSVELQTELSHSIQ